MSIMGLLGGVACGVALGAMFKGTMFHSYGQPGWVRCQRNLRVIDQGLLLYANDHGGQLPDRLEDLVSQVGLAPRDLVCPDTWEEGGQTPGCSYVYQGRGKRMPLSPGMILVSEPVGNHDGERANVLYGDGTVTSLTGAAARALPQKARQGSTTRP